MTARLTPYLSVRDARAAIDWYTEALGARLVGDPVVMDDDRIGHAELDVAGARFYLSDAYPEIGVVAPEPEAHPVSLVLTVTDVDTVVGLAADCGAVVERRPEDQPYGRVGVVVDPYGHRWMLESPAPGDPAQDGGPRPGDTVYLTLQVPDGARARDFYEAVLGWSIAPGRVEDGWQASGVTPMVGIHGGNAECGAVPMFAVDDIEVAVAAVRTAGGEAGAIEQQSFGRSALCRDDQGLPFWLGQLR